MAHPTTATQLRGTHIYRAVDWGGWFVLVGLGLVFLATGLSIRLTFHTAHPIVADLIAFLTGLFTCLWVVFFYSLRVSAHATVSDEGITLTHGPVQHTIAWDDVARLSEWTTLDEGFRNQWMAIWSTSGMRLQIRQDLVASYSTFRNDVIDRLAQPRGIPAEVVDLDKPLALVADLASPLTTWGGFLVGSTIAGGLVLAFLHTIPWVGIVIIALSLGILLSLVIAHFWRPTIFIDGQGISATRGPWHNALNWSAIYGLERKVGSERPSFLAIIGRLILVLLYSSDRRSSVVPTPARGIGLIVVEGGSGQRIAIREAQYRHPSWIRARLRLEVERLREQAAPLAPQVSPLPQTGPLAAGVVLPPDPMEGSSTLWLRESTGIDPFRGE